MNYITRVAHINNRWMLCLIRATSVTWKHVTTRVSQTRRPIRNGWAVSFVALQVNTPRQYLEIGGTWRTCPRSMISLSVFDVLCPCRRRVAGRLSRLSCLFLVSTKCFVNSVKGLITQPFGIQFGGTILFWLCDIYTVSGLATPNDDWSNIIISVSCRYLSW